MKRSIFISLFLVFLFIGMFIYPVEAKHYVTVPCSVIEVIDGDTIYVAIPDYNEINQKEDLNDTPYGGVLHAKETIRLEGVDCPEMDTIEGIKAKAFTDNFLKSDNVSVKIYIVDGTKWGHYAKHDPYGRLIGDLLVDGKSLSDALVKNGLAVYQEY